MIEENSIVNNREVSDGYSDALTVYILYGISFVIGITWIAAFIYAYLKRHDLQNTIYYSHMNYVIRTCWWTIFWGIVGFILSFFFVGFLVLFALTIWAIYRGVKGYITLKDGKAIL